MRAAAVTEARVFPERRQFEILLTRLLSDFTEHGKDLDALVETWLAHLGRCLAVDHAAVYRYNPNGNGFERAYGWTARSNEPLPASVNPSAYFGPRSLSRIRRGQILRFDTVENLASTAERNRKGYRAHSPKSALGLPFRMDSRSCYLVCAANQSRRWPDLLVHQLQLVAEVFAGAIARRRAEQELDDVTGKLIQAQEEERKRIGRELHDHIGGRMAMLAATVDQLGDAPSTSTGRASARRHATGLRQQIKDVAREVRDLSHGLHPDTLEYVGLVAALRQLVSEFSQRHHLAIAFTHTSVPQLPADTTLSLFRVAEESLTNVVKHSGARSARVNVRSTSEAIELTIGDSGIGFEPRATSGGLGLLSMRERMRLVIGTIDIRSAPCRGTKVQARILRSACLLGPPRLSLPARSACPTETVNGRGSPLHRSSTSPP